MNPIHEYVELPGTREQVTEFALRYAGERSIAYYAAKQMPVRMKHSAFARLRNISDAIRYMREWHLNEATPEVRAMLITEDRRVLLAGIELYRVLGPTKRET